MLSRIPSLVVAICATSLWAGELRLLKNELPTERLVWDNAGSQDVSHFPTSYILNADSNSYVIVHAEFEDTGTCDAFAIPNTHVISRHKQFCDLFILNDQKTKREFLSQPGLRWCDVFSTRRIPDPPPPTPHTVKRLGIAEDLVRGGIDVFDGTGVILAILDTGIDFGHPDFVNDVDGKISSRLFRYWDTTFEHSAPGIPGPVTYPNGQFIGRIFDTETLTTELRCKTPEILERDTDGHGTACAGIAAGTGRASNGSFEGVAPGCDLVAVKLGKSNLDNAYLFGGVIDWLEKLASEKNKPFVVSCSFGTAWGGRDGFRVIDRQLSSRFALDVRGRALCAAAGNQGNQNLHLRGELTGKHFDLAWTSIGPACIQIWTRTGEDDLRFDAEKGVVAYGESQLHGLSHHTFYTINVERGGVVRISTRSGNRSVFDAYISGAKASFQSGDDRSLLDSPGTAHNAISVGSYNWNEIFHSPLRTLLLSDPLLPGSPLGIGRLSSYSSSGPLRFGDTTKPDIVAPGQWYAAPAAFNAAATRDKSGYYQLFNGTSAATPYTAGVIAMLFEADENRKLTVGDIKRLFNKNASPPSSEPDEGESAAVGWGVGKLDKAAVQKMLQDLH